jgi:hypothetical protein
MLASWHNLSEQIKALQREELSLRVKLIDFVKPTIEDGSKTVQIGNGWALRATRRSNYNANFTASTKLASALPQEVASSLFSWTPNVLVTGFKEALPAYRSGLSEADRLTLDKMVIDAITVTPGTPSLALIEPKEK